MSNSIKMEDIKEIVNMEEVQNNNEENEVPAEPVDNRTRLQKFADQQAAKKVARENKKAEKQAQKAANKANRKGLTTKEKVAIGIGAGLAVGGLILKTALSAAEQQSYESVEENSSEQVPCFPVEEDAEVETTDASVEEAQVEET